MNTITSFLKKNPCYIANQEFNPKGIMVSMVGCPQPSAKVFINNWNRESCDKVCPHILIDANDGKIYQTLPYCVRGRGVKPDFDEKGNVIPETDSVNDYIQVFLCEPCQIKYRKGSEFEIVGDKEKALEAVDRTYSSLIEVCTSLCNTFGFGPIPKVYAFSNPSNKDPNTFWKQLHREGQVPYNMEALSNSVNEALTKLQTAEVTIGIDLANGPDYTVVNGEVIPNPNFKAGEIKSFVVNTPEEEAAKDEVFEYPDELPAEPDELITIQIDVPNLRIRKGPGTGAGCEPIGKYTGAGQFQVTEIQNGTGSQRGWAKLASGEGWVSMDFARIV